MSDGTSCGFTWDDVRRLCSLTPSGLQEGIEWDTMDQWGDAKGFLLDLAGRIEARLRDRASPDFKGATYREGVDGKRLADQFERVWAIMRDGEYHTIQEVAATTGDPAQSVARQMGHIRSKARGGHVLEREHWGQGLYAFRVNFGATRDQD